MIAIDLSKQNALDADSKAIQNINFTENLDQAGDTAISFSLEKFKETILDFSEEKIIGSKCTYTIKIN